MNELKNKSTYSLEPDHLVEPALPLTSCVTFNKLLNLSVLWLLICKNGHSNSIQLLWLLWELNDLAEVLQSNCYITTNYIKIHFNMIIHP